MIKVGITGGIGSGKSTVASIFECLGIAVYYADYEAKKLYDTDADLKSKLIQYFGPEIYPNGLFDKNVLKESIFKDEEKLKWLNQTVHPKVKEHANNWMNQQSSYYALKEAALMIESGSNTDLDVLILVTCPEEVRIDRVMKRDHCTKEEVLLRIQQQLPDSTKKKFADYEIINDDQSLLIPQVLAIHKSLLDKTHSK